MAGQFEATAEINRPVEEVFAFLSAGTNDPKFSPRVQAITKTPEGPTAVGTVFTSTVKDAGMKTGREFGSPNSRLPTESAGQRPRRTS